ncbi:MAG: T9SS type A sorting domain-containing protein [Chitinophagales bacterium]|nr:T9SS type A sorting domain-containing protein [Chitinophagaceae bacterium]MCB9065650.1 T9SS type A sorting domain-containing protein [Chitinophagales bacterium]
MKKALLLILSLPFAISSTSNAQKPVWSTDIAPILYNNCVSCHRTGGIGPFEMVTYNTTVSKAASIAASVTTGYMPPWPPDPTYQRLAHERLLSQADIKKISDWVNGGTPQGDPNLAPPPPTFNPNGDISGTADLEIQIPTFTSTASSGDVYQCFVIPSGLSAEKYIESFEAIPGNRDIVHHVIVYADTTGVCANLDAQTSGPGYVSFGGPGTSAAIMIGGWVPGTPPLELPKGFGIRIPKNADIVLQIHYPAGSSGMVDSTKLRFFFSKSTSTRSVRIDPVLNHLGALCTMTPSSISIPANQTQLYTQFSNVSSFVGDITLLGIAPHMHLIGRSINAYGVKAGDTLKLIDIPKWDFSWQGFYLFRKLIKLPQGTTLYSEAFFDNTSNNPFNPSNPPITVKAGEATTDEMMLTYFIWTQYKSGDESIDIDTSTLVPVGVENTVAAYGEQEMFAPYPNPSSGKLYVKYYLQEADDVTISVIDIQGRVVKSLTNNEHTSKAYHAEPYTVNDVPNGTYILQMRTSKRTFTEKISIQH